MTQPAPVNMNRPTPTIEDYLAIIYIMQRDGEPVVAARLAASLDVAPPTVTMTLKRMERDGWTAVDPQVGVHLTEAGLQAAASVLRRHMLTEWMLARMLNVSWSNVHTDAHHLEHSISDEIEHRMRANLDDPHTCPHGNPLPGYEYVAEKWIPLVQIPAGSIVTIRRIHETAEDNPNLMHFLEANGMLPGVTAKVTEVLDFNQTISLIVNGRTVSLGFAAGRYVFVEHHA